MLPGLNSPSCPGAPARPQPVAQLASPSPLPVDATAPSTFAAVTPAALMPMPQAGLPLAAPARLQELRRGLVAPTLASTNRAPPPTFPSPPPSTTTPNQSAAFATPAAYAAFAANALMQQQRALAARVAVGGMPPTAGAPPAFPTPPASASSPSPFASAANPLHHSMVIEAQLRATVHAQQAEVLKLQQTLQQERAARAAAERERNDVRQRLHAAERECDELTEQLASAAAAGQGEAAATGHGEAAAAGQGAPAAPAAPAPRQCPACAGKHRPHTCNKRRADSEHEGARPHHHHPARYASADRCCTHFLSASQTVTGAGTVKRSMRRRRTLTQRTRRWTRSPRDAVTKAGRVGALPVLQTWTRLASRF